MKKLILSILCLSLFAVYAFAQDRTITGTVSSSDGQPIPGVAIKATGSAGGTVTDIAGKYVIKVSEGVKSLTFSYLGMQSQVKVIGTNTSAINVTLQDDLKSLTEVVITAGGIQKDKASLGYSADMIKAAEITNGRQTNLINGITGKTPGVQVGRSSGGVNTATRITLRGVRSLTGPQEPLFVIDGVPVDNSSVQPSGSSSAQVDVGNRIGDINPDDIESITILKGPNASALYGTLGSNGAILITTKTGKDASNQNKKLGISFTSAYIMDKVQKLPELQNEFGSGYDDGAAAVYDPIENTNWGPKLDGSMVQSGPTLANGHKLMIPFSAVKDNAKNFFNTGSNIQNSLSLQSGNATSSFYGSFSDTEVKGIIPSDKFRRNTVKLSGSAKLANLFNVSGNISYNKNIMNTSFNGTGNSSVLNDVLNVSRQIDLSQFKDWRNYEFATTQGFFNGYQPNPYFALDNNRFNSNLDRILGSLQIGFDPYKWLNISYRLGTDYSSDRRKQTFEKVTYGTGQRPAATTGAIIEDAFSRRIVNSDFIVTARQDLNKDFNLALTLLNNVRQDDNRNLTASASAISIPGFFNLSNRIGELGGSEVFSKRRIIGFAGDLTLGYKNYLFLNGTLRNDISSTLPKENNSYFYPSGNASFVLTEAIESLKNNKILSYAKLRASVAKVGTDTSPYNLVPTFVPGGGFPYGALAGFSVNNTTPNPFLKPEFTTSYEAGTELSFLNDKIGLDVTYYYTSTDGQIISIGVAPSSGFSNAFVNAGNIINKGIEVGFKGSPFKNANGFSWNFNFSYTHNVNSITSLYLDAKSFPLGSGDPVPTAIVGEPLSLYGTAYLRDPQGRVVVDGTTGNIRKANDIKNLGAINPKHILGFNTTLAYKNFSFAATLDFRAGNVIYSGTQSTLNFTGSSKITTSHNRERFVWPNSVIETSPGVYASNTTVKTQSGSYDFWHLNYNSFAESNIIDASFLKLRDISLNYQLPKKLLANSPFGRATVGLTGANFLVWTPKSNNAIDPEANIFGNSNSQGREFTGIPSTKSYGLTLSATF